MNRASAIRSFIDQLEFSTAGLPAGIKLLNPYRNSAAGRETTRQFFNKFYNDEDKRVLLLGINPGRFGAGITGISFTDPKRLVSALGLPFEGKVTHEPSSEFIYDMIGAYGGVSKFYGEAYISSLFPLTVIRQAAGGKLLNYNYYDDADLMAHLRPFIIKNIYQQIDLAGGPSSVICPGTGKNAAILRKLNDAHGFFKRIIAIEHPRFIVQYKYKERHAYNDKYLRSLEEAKG
jgi:hypothetical protein